MRTRRIRAFLAAAVAVALSAVLSGCGLTSGSALALTVGPGKIKHHKSLEGVQFVVGSKEFSEQVILGDIILLGLKAAGADVVDRTGINGSNSARNAELAGGIDVQYEYTGTAWISYLNQTKPIPDSVKQFDAVKRLDLKRNGMVWFDRAPLNNTYAFATTKKTANRLQLQSLSDVAKLAHTNPKEATFCIESEFAGRDDGMPGVLKAYDFSVPKGNIKQMATGLIYGVTAKGQQCNFGEVFTTDGRIQALHLVVLKDDKHFFPIYNPALYMPKKLFYEHPEVKQIFAPVSKELTTPEIQKLNAKVDVNGDDPLQVAKNWMIKKGFITG